ncbi:MAG: hypothetical protein GY845_09380 [Planctomycetes bacterium]|nr:hypothetical protein [Planctomycetota bacterium]
MAAKLEYNATTLVSNFTTFQALLDSFGADAIELLIVKKITLLQNTIVPANIALRLTGKGEIDNDGFDLTINGPFIAGLKKVFSGVGDIVFGNNSIKSFYPQWTGAIGDGINDDSLAICRAMNCATASGITTFFPAGEYVVDLASMPGGTNYASAMQGTKGETTINLTGAVSWVIVNGFSLQDINFITDYTYANAVGTFYYTFTTGAAGPTTPMLYDTVLLNIKYTQATVTDGTARGYGLIIMNGGVTNLVAENIWMEGIRHGITVAMGNDGVDGYNGNSVCIDASFRNIHGKNMQRIISPGSPGVSNMFFGSRGIVIDNWSLINTEAQGAQYSGGARTGHSAIIGDMGVGAIVTSGYVEWVIEHTMYVYGRTLTVSDLSSVNGSDIKIVGYATTNTSSANIFGITHIVNQQQWSTSAGIITLYYVDGVKISGIHVKGSNVNDGSGGVERTFAVVSLSRSARSIDINDVSGQYLTAGIVSYLTDPTWEEAFDGITIRNCNVLDPVSPATSYYAALNKYLTYYPDDGGAHATWVAGDALIQNVIIMNNFFGQTTETLGAGESLTLLGRGRSGTRMTGLVFVQDMRGVRTSNNTLSGWYGLYSVHAFDSAAAGNKGYSNKVYLDEIMFIGANFAVPARLAQCPALSEQSRLEYIGRKIDIGGVVYLSGSGVVSKGSSSGLTVGECESITAGGSIHGSFTVVLDTNERVAGCVPLINAVGTIELSTDRGDYILANINGVGAPTAVAPVSANASVTSVNAKICLFRDGNFLTLDNDNTGVSIVATVKYRISYQS